MMNTPMSVDDLRHWIRGSGVVLEEAGVTAVHGAGPNLGHEGSTWISFSSSWGSGRLVRAPDGSSRTRAYRFRDGTVLVDDHASTTTRQQLSTLVRILAPTSA